MISSMNIYALSIIFVLVMLLVILCTVLINAQAEIHSLSEKYTTALQERNFAASEADGLRAYATQVSNGWYGGAQILESGQTLEESRSQYYADVKRFGEMNQGDYDTPVTKDGLITKALTNVN